jgi:hypothetical protein
VGNLSLGVRLLQSRRQQGWREVARTESGASVPVLGRINRREIPRLRRPAISQERSRKKKPVRSARNDR